jgi:hypothetical protein
MRRDVPYEGTNFTRLEKVMAVYIDTYSRHYENSGQITLTHKLSVEEMNYSCTSFLYNVYQGIFPWW